MNEVEKMYENAGIKKKPYCELNCSITKNDFECTSYCLHYEDEGLYYPPFTAEKQIELIKWLVKINYSDERIINYFNGGYYCLYSWDEFSESENFKTYEEALACAINYIWQDLTDAEKAQIKEILE